MRWQGTTIAVSAISLLLLNCSPMETTGQTAASHGVHEGDANAGSGQPPVDTSIPIGSHGKLEVSGGPFTVGEEGYLKLTFTTDKSWRRWVSGSGGEPTYPSLSLSFKADNNNRVESSCHSGCEGDAIHKISSNGRYIQMNITEEEGASFTFHLKINAQDSFTLTPRLHGEGIDAKGRGKDIIAHPNEDGSIVYVGGKPISLEGAANAIGRHYNPATGNILPDNSIFGGMDANPSKTNAYQLDIKRFKENATVEIGAKKAFALLDYKDLVVDNDKPTKMRLTFIAGGDIGGKRKHHSVHGKLGDVDTKIYVKFPEKFGYRISAYVMGGNKIKSLKKVEKDDKNVHIYTAKIDQMKPYEHFYIDFTVEATTKYLGSLGVWADIYEAGEKNTVIGGLGIPVTKNIKINEERAGDYFRIKYKEDANKRLQVFITALKKIEGGRNDAITVDCGVHECELYEKELHTHVEGNKVIQDSDDKSKHTFQLNDMDEGSTITLTFELISGARRTTYYYPSLTYKDKNGTKHDDVGEGNLGFKY